MDYLSAFAVSSAGMQSERMRLDVAALNIANVHTSRTTNGGIYTPLSVVTRNKKSFFNTYQQINGIDYAPTASIVPQTDTVPRLVFEPTHPDANKDGYVAYPGIDTVNEMVNLMTAVRAYEANVVALNAAKSMALKAIDIGNVN